VLLLSTQANAYTIDGTVLLSGQTDHSGVPVIFTEIAPGSAIDTVYTDANGYFSFTHEDDATYFTVGYNISPSLALEGGLMTSSEITSSMSQGHTGTLHGYHLFFGVTSLFTYFPALGTRGFFLAQ